MSQALSDYHCKHLNITIVNKNASINELIERSDQKIKNK